MLLFSVIIPVYKTEKYLNQCVDSVLNLNFKDLEIILVDDGSPDSCPKICDDYAKKYDCVKVIHKENGGASTARNAGIYAAAGEYILFMDSDDYLVNEGCLSDLVESINEYGSDLVVYGISDFFPQANKVVKGTIVYDCEYLSGCCKKEALEYLFKNSKFPGSPCRVAVRRELIISEKIRFMNGMTAEDYDWLLAIFFAAESYSAINTSVYICRKYRTGSVTETADVKSIRDLFFALDKWTKIMEDESFLYIRDYVYAHLAYAFFTTFVIAVGLSKKDRKAIMPDYKRYTFLLSYTNGLKSTFFKYIYKLFGFSAAVYFAGMQNRLKKKLNY